MEALESFDTLQSKVIKKEPVDDEEIYNKYENISQPVKQEYYSNPELQLDWDEKYNVSNEIDVNPENGDGDCNIFSKLYNPRVLLERLSDSVLTKYSRPENISLKTENLYEDTEKFNEFAKNVSAGPEGGKSSSKAKNFLTNRECSKCRKKFKNQLSLRQHLLHCGKLPHLQCSHCTYKTKYKSALKYHTSHKHLSKSIITKSSKCGKKFQSLKFLKRDSSRNKQTRLNCTFKTKSSLSKHLMQAGQSKSKKMTPCSKCNKKFKYKTSLTKHLALCNGSSDFGTTQSTYTTKSKKYLKKHVTLKKLTSEKVCPKCKRLFKYGKPFNQHLISCKAKAYAHCKYCTYKTKYPSDLAHHVSQAHRKKKVYQKDVHPECSNCNKKFNDQKTLKAHWRYCTQPLDLQLCLKCGKSYKHQNSLKNHQRFCGKKPHLQCNYCIYKTKRRGDLSIHVSTVHLQNNSNNFFTCSKCGRNYKNRRSLRVHLRVCGMESRIRCDHCSYKTHWKADVAKHIKNVHLEKDVNYFLPCSNCGKRYKNQATLNIHLRTCGKEPHIQCDDCSYKTHWKTTMAGHIIRVHLEKNVHYFLPCSKCGKRYKNKESLTRHMGLCGEKLHLECDYCSYKTNMKTLLARHILAVHLEKDSNYFLPCPKCGKRYKNQSSLTRHSYLCGKERHLQCDYCTYKTNLKPSMAKHILAVHLENNSNYCLPCSKCGKRYKNHQSLTRHLSFCGKKHHLQCDYCSYKTNIKQSMERHIVRAHLEKDVNHFLPCLKCGKRYKNKQSLTQHVYVCAKERHLQCDYCSHKTNLKTSLKKHILAVHLEKDVNYCLPCPKCSKKYKNQSSLSRHLYLCGNERHLQCDYCCYKTNLKASLTSHIVAVHLEKESNHFLPCRKCGGTYKNQISLKSHSAYCGKKSNLKCHHCSYVTNRKTSLAKHIQHVHCKKNQSSRGWSKYKTRHGKQK